MNDTLNDALLNKRRERGGGVVSGDDSIPEAYCFHYHSLAAVHASRGGWEDEGYILCAGG